MLYQVYSEKVNTIFTLCYRNVTEAYEDKKRAECRSLCPVVCIDPYCFASSSDASGPLISSFILKLLLMFGLVLAKLLPLEKTVRSNRAAVFP